MAKNRFRRRHISAYRFLKLMKREPLFIIDLDMIPIEVDVKDFCDKINSSRGLGIQLLPLSNKKIIRV